MDWQSWKPDEVGGGENKFMFKGKNEIIKKYLQIFQYSKKKSQFLK